VTEFLNALQECIYIYVKNNNGQMRVHKRDYKYPHIIAAHAMRKMREKALRL